MRLTCVCEGSLLGWCARVGRSGAGGFGRPAAGGFDRPRVALGGRGGRGGWLWAAGAGGFGRPGQVALVGRGARGGWLWSAGAGGFGRPRVGRSGALACGSPAQWGWCILRTRCEGTPAPPSSTSAHLRPLRSAPAVVRWRTAPATSWGHARRRRSGMHRAQPRASGACQNAPYGTLGILPPCPQRSRNFSGRWRHWRFPGGQWHGRHWRFQGRWRHRRFAGRWRHWRFAGHCRHWRFAGCR